MSANSAAAIAGELPKAYDPHAIERDIAKLWDDQRAFHAEPGDPGEPYSIVIPPPNVTSILHLGHALNNTVQDILTRVHRMRGLNAVWVPGTDHAGISTQTVVEKRVLQEEGKRRTDFSRDEFVAKIQAWKDEYERRITEQLVAMGCSCDYARQAFTMDESRARAVREAFFQLFKDGLIYRGKRLVNWDPATQTALADDEVEMEEVDGFFYYLRYPIVSDDGAAEAHGQAVGLGFEYVTVATTRPETMLGDTAVAINPRDPRAASLRGKKVRLPIVNRVIPIIEDDYVVLPDPNSDDPKAKFATGFLKVTPAHDPNDYEIGQRHKLPIINVLAPDGTISEKYGWTDVGDAEFAVGLDRYEAREAVVEWFRSHNLLEETKPYRHSVGHSYRSHVAIEPYLSDQWYCRVTDDRLRGAALRAMAPDQVEGPTSRDRKGAGETATSRDRKGADPRPLADARGSLTAYFITFTCYGTWLHGDDRGSADRAHNLPGTPYLVGDEQRERSEFDSLKHPPMTLDEAQRRVVQDTVREVCQHRDWALLAAHVRPKHVHSVVLADATPEKVMNDFKAYATRRLREANLIGEETRVWTRHGSTRYLNDDDSVINATKYVIEDQGASLEPAPFDGRDLRTSRERERAEGQPLPDGRGSLAAAEREGLRFFPARYAKTFQAWLENLRDWCISRQLWWGHRIPVWRHDAPSKDALEWLALNDKDDVHHLVRMGESAFVCLREATDQNTLSGMIAKRLEIWGFKQDPDVLDTWFSSGLWPMSTLGWPPAAEAASPGSALEVWNPTSVLCTAREIITLWVSRMVMFNLYFLDRLPFEHVYIHAMIQDGHGQKMSKSLGNGIDPLDIIATHGTDAMRFTLASMATNTQDMRMPVTVIDPYTNEPAEPKWTTIAGGYTVMEPKLFSKNDQGKPFWTSYGVSIGANKGSDLPVARNTSPKVDLGRNFANKLWNAARFVLMSIEGVAPEPSDELKWSMADRWIVSRFNRTVAECDEAVASYRFDQYARACYDFFWRDFCDWYVEASKPAMKDPARHGQTANILAATLDGALRLLHPIIPFITEQVWQRLCAVREERGLAGRIMGCTSKLLIKAAWPKMGESGYSEAAEHIWPKLQELVTVIRNVRNEHKVDPKRVIKVSVKAPGDSARQIEAHRPEIETLAVCALDAVSSDAKPGTDSIVATAAGCEVYLEGLVDKAAEEQRVAKRCEELKKAIAAMKGRLANQGYLAKAPPHLVQETKDQLAKAEEELKKLGCA